MKSIINKNITAPTVYIDCHIHIEKGDYTLGWIDRFVETAVNRGIDEIWLLEHCYLFPEFVSMYDKLRSTNEYLDKWFARKAGKRDFSAYLRLVEKVRELGAQGRRYDQRGLDERQGYGFNERREHRLDVHYNLGYPVKIKFGLEVCYFKEHEELVYNATKDNDLDFIVGSVHFIDNFAYDHGENNEWKGINVNWAYDRYFETAGDLAESGIYNGIAHPDLLKLFGHKPSYSLLPYYDGLAAALAKTGMYAEQNGGAYRRCPDTCEPGMDAGLIKALRNENVTILTASDAHRPEDVGIYVKEMQELLQ